MVPKFTYLFSLVEFLWRIFLLLRANRLYLIFNTGLKKMPSSCLAEFLCLLLPGVLGFGSVSYEPCPTTNFSYYLFPLAGRSPHFRFRVPANRLASTFFLPVLGDPSESPLCDLHSFLTVIVWRLATVNSTTGNSINLISIVSVGDHVTVLRYDNMKTNLQVVDT